MKIELANNFGLCEELPLRSKRYVVSMYMPFLSLYVDNEVISGILVNGKEVDYKVKNNVIVIPCLFNADNISIVEIGYDGNYLRYMFKYDKSVKVDNKLIMMLGDFYRRAVDFLEVGKVDLNKIIDGINDGDLSLLHFLDPMTGIEEGNFLEEIERVIPFALDICTNPRKHLKVENEIIDIEKVKKVTSQSLMHLSSNSQHWKARTLTGLIPSRMLSEVYEDDIDIYENTFFKMVIDKIMMYITSKQLEVDRAISQKDRIIDWQQYGNVFSDYKRGEIVDKLFSLHDVEREETSRTMFYGLKGDLSYLEKGISSIVGSAFYQSIDKFKVLSLPIEPTNIIKMDNRYNELFKLWNKFMNNSLDERQVAISGAFIDNINYYYLLYVQICLIYGLHIYGLNKDKSSYFEIFEDGLSMLDVDFSNDDFVVSCKTESNEKFCRIDVSISEKPKMKVKYPSICILDGLLDSFANVCVIDDEDHAYVIFKNKLSDEDRKNISGIFRNVDIDGISNKQKGKMDKEWRQFVANTMINYREGRKFNIYIYTMLYSLGSKETNIKTNTENILNGASLEGSGNFSVVYCLPIDLYQFKEFDKTIVSRLFGYGESYDVIDAPKWGDYKVGILPIFQTEVNSIQRLIKLVSMHISKLGIEWGIAKDKCPLCGSYDVFRVDEDTCKCRGNGCGILWGTTRCSNGCGETFSWMRPDVSISKEDIDENEPLKLKLKKESIFDRLIITDFDFVKDSNGIKYVPRCPKCGFSSVNS